MDTRDGRIYIPEQVEMWEKILRDSPKTNSFDEFTKIWERRRDIIPMEVPPTDKQMSRKPPKVGRSEPCPCGSGKKFKKCCLKLTR